MATKSKMAGMLVAGAAVVVVATVGVDEAVNTVQGLLTGGTEVVGDGEYSFMVGRQARFSRFADPRVMKGILPASNTTTRKPSQALSSVRKRPAEALRWRFDWHGGSMSRLSADLVRKYAWAEPLALELVWTLTVIEGSSLPEVVRSFGGDPSAPEGVLTFREAEREVRRAVKEFGGFFFVQVLTHGRHVIAMENNGYSGIVPEMGRQLTAAGGNYLSYFRNDNGASKLVQAIDGRITAYFEPLFADEPRQVGDILPAWIDGVDIDTETLWATCFALLEEQTGIAFDPEWFTAKLPVYRIPDPYTLFKDIENADAP